MKKVLAKVQYPVGDGLFSWKYVERIMECDVSEEYKTSVKVTFAHGEDTLERIVRKEDIVEVIE
jgi:hypothetical protein